MDPPARVAMDMDFQVFVSHRIPDVTPDGAASRVRWRETARIESTILRWVLKLNSASIVEKRHQGLISAGTAAAR